jgi:hypothetical protein
MTIGVTKFESLIEIAHVGTLGPLGSIVSENRAKKSLLGFASSECIAADAGRLQVKFINKHQDSLDSRADRTH